MSSRVKRSDEPAAHWGTQQLVTIGSHLKWASTSCTRSLSYLCRFLTPNAGTTEEFLSVILFLVFLIGTGRNRGNCIQPRAVCRGQAGSEVIKLSRSVIAKQRKLAQSLSLPWPNSSFSFFHATFTIR